MTGKNSDSNESNMNVVYSECRKFARRHDFDIFSMSDYNSCENCRHLNGDNQCTKKIEEGRNGI